jgi:hypothetical protein
VSLSEELKQLETLLQSGTLTPEEFATAKRRAIDGSPVGPSEEELEDLKIQTEINQLDLEWLKERGRYGITNHYRSRAPRLTVASIIGPVFGVGSGMILIVAAFQSNVPRDVRNVMLFVAGVTMVVSICGYLFRYLIRYVQVSLYDDALQRYKLRREVLVYRQLQINDEIHFPEDFTDRLSL